jgi:phosphoribosylanthranilate isomerase
MDDVRVKICGLTRLEDAQAAVELGAWAVGMVFAPESRRRCSLEQAERIGAALHRRAEIAGVFVNAHLDEIAELHERVGFTLVQLQGEEGPAFAAEVARRTGARIIKAAAVRGPGTLQNLARFHTDFHLLDGHQPGLSGGTGTSFDWSLLARRRSKVPLILSGGLRAENVGEAIARTNPFAVDVASGVEAAPGIKEHELMREFFAAAGAAVAV